MFSGFRSSSRSFLKGLIALAPFVVVVLSITLQNRHSAFPGTSESPAFVYAAQEQPRVLSPISIDYPEDGSVFPPGITPPTFLWRDAAGTSWSIDVTFADKSAPVHALSKGERMRLGEIDPECVSDSNSPPFQIGAIGGGADEADRPPSLLEAGNTCFAACRDPIPHLRQA